MKYILFLLCYLPIGLLAQEKYQMETRDIDHFWQAFDLLGQAKSREDSIQTIQEYYIDKATPFFKEFLRVRHFTAKEYIKRIARYPRFWHSVRPLTENIKNRRGDIDAVFQGFREKLPGFKQPDICFAIGCLRTGGTISGKLILIGSEIAASDSTVDKSEMRGWLNTVIGNTKDIVAMIAHESVHTQQFNRRKLTLLTGALTEGVADFISVKLFDMSINAGIYEYGEQHECEIWKEFEEELARNPEDYSNWLYQGNRSKNRPADLGYYIGYKIAESYYEQEQNKEKALKNLLNQKKAPEILKKSKYSEKACN